MSQPQPPGLLIAREALRLGTERLKRAGFESAALEMSLLLADALGLDRLGLYTNLDRPLDPAERDRARERLARRLHHEPVAYIVGRREFYGLPFEVTPAVLIPRPETELIVEQVLAFAQARAALLAAQQSPLAEDAATAASAADATDRTDPTDPTDTAEAAQPAATPAPAPQATTPATQATAPATQAATPTPPAPPPVPLRAADVGTGSGAIAVALAHALPGSTWLATDISPEALAVAERNAQRNGVAERVEFRAGDLLAPLAGQSFDVICSNPPYIDPADRDALPPDVRDHEPAGALFAAQQGLACLRSLIAGAAPLLHADGLLLLECGAGQAPLLLEFARALGSYARAEALHDLAGIERTLALRKA